MGFKTHPKLARRLLYRAARLVSDSIFFGLVMYSVGCIIPTNLEEQSGETQYPPSFVPGGESPLFSKLQKTSSDPAWDWRIKATDPNLGDALTARLLLCDLAMPQIADTCSWMIDIPLVRQPSTGSQPDITRLGTSDSRNWCLNTKLNTYEVRVIVSDAKFDDMHKTNTFTGGNNAENHWELECD